MRREKLEELKKYIEEFKTIKKEEIIDNRNFLKIKKQKYYLNNGEVIVREKIIKNNKDGSASIIMPVTKDNNVILIVEPRVLTKRGVGVGFPAGYIENCEDPARAAQRELLEETGYKSEKLIELTSFYQDEGCLEAYNHIFLALGCEKTDKQKLDESEFVKFMEVTYDEAIELEEMGYIEGSNSIIAIEKSKKYMLKNKSKENIL